MGTVVAGGGLLTLVLFSLVSIPLAADLRLGWVTVAEVVRAAIMAVADRGAGARRRGAGAVPGRADPGRRRVAGHRPRPRPPARCRCARRCDLGRWWELARATLPYAAAIAVSAIYFRITIILMSLVSREQETGYFAVSYRVIEVLVGVPTLLAGAAFPILSRAARDDAGASALRAQRTLDMMFIERRVGRARHRARARRSSSRCSPARTPSRRSGTLQIQALALACTFVAVPCGYMLLALRRHRAILLGNLGSARARRRAHARACARVTAHTARRWRR